MHIGLTVLSNKLDLLAEKYVNVSMSTKIGVDQLDKDLARNILKYHMLPPSTMPYNISTKDNNPSVGQAQIMELLFEEEVNDCEACVNMDPLSYAQLDDLTALLAFAIFAK